MRESHAETMTVQEVREHLVDLVRSVSHGHKRVAIAHPTGDVVLVSKTEIDALARALSIMAETAEFKTVAHSLHRIAVATVDQPVVA